MTQERRVLSARAVFTRSENDERESFRPCALIGPSRLTSQPSNYGSVFNARRVVSSRTAAAAAAAIAPLFSSLSYLSESTVDVLFRGRLCFAPPTSISADPSVRPSVRSTGSNNGKPPECKIDVTDRRKRGFVNIFGLSSRTGNTRNRVYRPRISEPPCVHAPPIAVNRFLFSPLEGPTICQPLVEVSTWKYKHLDR